MVTGAGSTAAFIERAFPPVDGVVASVVAIAAHRGDLPAVMSALSTGVLRAREHDRAVIVGGVSFGAHAAATYASTCLGPERPDALACVMPAWTGSPSSAAAATEETAQRLRGLGSEAVLADLRRQHPDDWIVDELLDAWPRFHPAALAAELEAVASCPAPSLEQLGRIRVPTAVVGLRGDPLHPIQVADAWARVIPGARGFALERAQVGAERSLLGRAAFGWLAGRISASR